MPYGGEDVADAHAHDDAPAHTRVREVRFTRRVERLDNRHVQSIAGRLLETGRSEAKADDGHRHGSGEYEAGIRFHPAGPLLGEPAVFADSGSNPVRSESTNDHPRLERPETPAELQPVVHVVDLAGGGVPG